MLRYDLANFKVSSNHHQTYKIIFFNFIVAKVNLEVL